MKDLKMNLIIQITSILKGFVWQS